MIETWMTPDELDHERIRFRRFKRQRGGFNNPLWWRISDAWRAWLNG